MKRKRLAFGDPNARRSRIRKERAELRALRPPNDVWIAIFGLLRETGNVEDALHLACVDCAMRALAFSDAVVDMWPWPFFLPVPAPWKGSRGLKLWMLAYRPSTVAAAARWSVRRSLEACSLWRGDPTAQLFGRLKSNESTGSDLVDSFLKSSAMRNATGPTPERSWPLVELFVQLLASAAGMRGIARRGHGVDESLPYEFSRRLPRSSPKHRGFDLRARSREIENCTFPELSTRSCALVEHPERGRFAAMRRFVVVGETALRKLDTIGGVRHHVAPMRVVVFVTERRAWGRQRWIVDVRANMHYRLQPHSPMRIGTTESFGTCFRRLLRIAAQPVVSNRVNQPIDAKELLRLRTQLTDERNRERDGYAGCHFCGKTRVELDTRIAYENARHTAAGRIDDDRTRNLRWMLHSHGTIGWEMKNCTKRDDVLVAH